MNWTNIKRWAKDKGYKVDRDKSGDEANPYNYEWKLLNDPARPLSDFITTSLKVASVISKAITVNFSQI